MSETINHTAAITEYSQTSAALAELRQRFENVAFDVSTAAGDKAARAARYELVKLRTGLEAKRKEIKAPALERSRLIDAEAKRITDEILALEVPIDQQITAVERAKEAERQAKIEAEARRVADELEAQRVARVAAEKAERDRIAAEHKAAADKLAADRAAFEAEQRAARAVQDELDRQGRAARAAADHQAATERAEQDRLAREARLYEERRQDAERAELRRKVDEIAAAERKAKEAEERRQDAERAAARHQAEQAAVADKRVHDVAHVLLAVLQSAVIWARGWKGGDDQPPIEVWQAAIDLAVDADTTPPAMA